MQIANARPLQGSGVTSNLAATTYFGPMPVTGRRLSITASWTGTPSGTFSLEQTSDGTTWATIPGASAEFTANSQAQPAGADGSAIWVWSNVPGTAVRLKYTRSGGTGTLTARSVWGI
jgi:hypothetical protein